MADKISENAGLESGNVTPEQLVEAMKLMGDFAKKNPEAALKLVKESLAANTTSPGVTPGRNGGSVSSVSGSTANF